MHVRTGVEVGLQSLEMVVPLSCVGSCSATVSIFWPRNAFSLFSNLPLNPIFDLKLPAIQQVELSQLAVVAPNAPPSLNITMDAHNGKDTMGAIVVGPGTNTSIEVTALLCADTGVDKLCSTALTSDVQVHSLNIKHYRYNARTWKTSDWGRLMRD